jgi:hypothetical protein
MPDTQVISSIDPPGPASRQQTIRRRLGRLGGASPCDAYGVADGKDWSIASVVNERIRSRSAGAYSHGRMHAAGVEADGRDASCHC